MKSSNVISEVNKAAQSFVLNYQVEAKNVITPSKVMHFHQIEDEVRVSLNTTSRVEVLYYTCI